MVGFYLSILHLIEFILTTKTLNKRHEEDSLQALQIEKAAELQLQPHVGEIYCTSP
jgi:hypothetical protein